MSSAGGKLRALDVARRAWRSVWQSFRAMPLTYAATLPSGLLDGAESPGGTADATVGGWADCSVGCASGRSADASAGSMGSSASAVGSEQSGSTAGSA